MDRLTSRQRKLVYGIGIVILLISQWPGVRSLGRLDLARVTKEQVS